VDAETWWEFMGWYLSEGSSSGVSDGIMRTHGQRFCVNISQYEKSDTWEMINDCLSRLGIHYSYRGHDFKIHSKELHSILFPLGNSYQKRIPRYLLNAPKELLQILYTSLVMGDGSVYAGRDSYFSVNKKLVDDFSELCVLLGMSVTIQNRNPSTTELPQGGVAKNPKMQYAANTRLRKTQELRNGSENNLCINTIYYNGNVYCVTTNTGAIVVKRNGKVSICGNCYGMAFDAAPLNEDLTINWTDEKLYSQMGAIGKECNLEWGGDWETFPDRPHFQYTFGLSIEDLLAGKRPPEQ
jgi:hypothetical protein